MRFLTLVRDALGSVGDGLWAVVDPDEPLFCDCTAVRPCVDCSLLDADDLDAAAA